MKSSLPLACLAVLALLLTTGCVSRYEITLLDQGTITTHGKPKVDKEKGLVRFTDAEGKKRVLPLFNVQKIEAR